MKIKLIIMAGGLGTRLWPLSRAMRPKQFLDFGKSHTLFQSSILRTLNLDIESTIVVCNEDHRFLVADQLNEINKLGKIIIEPEGRNTAPAIALAALHCDPDDTMLVLPSDHIIKNEDAFTYSVEEALSMLNKDRLVTFGIKPTNPHTGYGYIEVGNIVDNGYKVNTFEEKPTIDLANTYFSSGKYLWNSGMFLFKSSKYLSELEKYRPKIFNACQNSMSNLSEDDIFIRPDKNQFSSSPSESIDYAVMEETKDAFVAPLEADWSDIGSWSSFFDNQEKDDQGNYFFGDVISLGTSNSLVYSQENFVSIMGVENILVISTKDAVLVTKKENSENIKELVEQIKTKNENKINFGRQVYRPWGTYDSIDNGIKHQVKRIEVKPYQKLSVQSHAKREEHWIVVSGTARVTNNGKTYDLKENESTFISLGSIHALENPVKEKLVLIEVQYGSYLGEDDITRFEDKYGRVDKKS